MAAVWTSALEIGDTHIDLQHRELFEAVNRSLEAAAEQRSAKEIDDLLSFLERYIVEHFAAEEGLMVRSEYEGYASHKVAHDGFVASCKDMRANFAATGATIELASRLQATVADWLVSHISKVDRELGKHLQAHGAHAGESAVERADRTGTATPY